MHLSLDGTPPSVTLAAPAGSRSIIETEVTIRRPRSSHLFVLYPPLSLQSDGFTHVNFNGIDHQFHASLRGSRVMRYTVRHAFPFAADPSVFAAYQQLMSLNEGAVRALPPQRARAAFDPDAYARGWNLQVDQIRDLTVQILHRVGLDRHWETEHDPRDATIAEALTNYLRENFLYLIAAAGDSGPGDPIMRFLFHRREGHCELFAAGLAAMARSIGMRARIVSGYLASEYNQTGGYYIVRPANAHAWCEIEISPGVWQRFDPTPPADRDLQHHVASTWTRRLRQFYEHLDYLWVRSVVAYDPRSQQAMLQTARDIVDRAAAADRQMLQQWRRFKQRFEGVGGSRWGFMLAGLLIVLFAVTVSITVLGRWRTVWGRRWWGWPWSRRGRARTTNNDPPMHTDRQAPFYQTMLLLLARHGYERPRWQGPRQFVMDLAHGHPRRFEPAIALTDLYYAVRYGGRSLDPLQHDEARRLLESLRHQLSDSLGENPATVA
jgi:protein-glutamine gamma-glutamyltransferase